MSDHASQVQRLRPHHYLFSSVWQLPAPRDAVFALLADVYRYPSWWPEFKTARPTGEDSGQLSLRSVLPITLHFTLRRDIEDPTTAHLRAFADGHIAGTVEWKVRAVTSETSEAHFREEVTLRHPVATRVDRALRPVLEWNHRMAMRSGAAGATKVLSETTRGPESHTPPA